MGGLAFVPQNGQPGYSRLLAPGRKPYKTLDGYLVATPYTNKHFATLLAAVGREGEMQTNPILRDVPTRQGHWPEIYELVSAILVTRTTAEWLDILTAGEVPAVKVSTLEDLVDDPHLNDVGMFRESDHPSEGRIREMRPPTRWSDADVSIRRHAPMIGEQSIEILREAGFDEATIAAMLASGATVDGSART